MGVAAFFRWLTEKFPKAVGEVLEKRCAVINGQAFPVDFTAPNPNGVEYDNLYVDMNGLIHPCSHPEDREAPSSEAEMYVNVTKYVDRLFAAVRPRRLLFLAIDGVAPRAKMNQQRSRRFRAAQDAQERAKVLEEVVQEMQAKGMDAPGGHAGEWDSNVITPGTEFMSRLSTYLWFYILDRMNRDAAWRSIKVILSDASEPGEGEHKIMKFIRDERAQAGYDPNQSHVIHGLDADLIMLALATHELHFSILREKVFFNKRDKESKQNKISEAQQLLDAQTKATLEKGAILAACMNPQDEWIYGKSLEILQISVLREYIYHEFKDLEPILPFKYDFERIIDDFIFMCFFVGNDFLPHLPSLDIRDGALDYLIEVYRDILPSLGDYLTSSGGVLNLAQVDVLLARVGEVEDDVFQRRKLAEDYRDAGKARLANQRNGAKQLTGAAKFAEQGKKMLNFAPTLQNMVPLSRKGAEPTAAVAKVRTTTEISVTALSTSGTSSTVSVVAEVSSSTAATRQSSAAENRSAAATLRDSLLGKRKTPAPATEVAEPLHPSSVDNPEMRGNEEDAEINQPDEGNEISKRGRPDEFEEDEEEEEEDQDIGDRVAPAVVAALAKQLDTSIAEGRAFAVIPSAAGSNSAGAAIASRVVDATKAAELQRKVEVARRLEELQNAKIRQLEEVVSDNIKFHELGWKARYYDDPFKKADIAKGGGLQRMCHAYVQGLVWVLKYYYAGCPSWNWYYPFHYAPFASDLRNIETYPVAPALELSTPFRPVEQLLAVLPKESVHALPKGCQWLMQSPESPILDVYDGDVPLDPNGKTLPWLWVLLLPFVDETRITAAFRGCVQQLTLDERRRNAWGGSLIFLHRSHPLAIKLQPTEGTTDTGSLRYAPGRETDTELLQALADEAQKLRQHSHWDNNDGDEVDAVLAPADGTLLQGVTVPQETTNTIDFNCEDGGGICGQLSRPPPNAYAPINQTVTAPKMPSRAFTDVSNNNVCVYTFCLPAQALHRSQILPGATEEQRKLTQFDLSTRRVPRLNRGGASIVDLAQKFRRREQVEAGRGGHQGSSFARDRYGPGQGQGGSQRALYAQQNQQHEQRVADHHAQQQYYLSGQGRNRGAEQAHAFQQYQHQQVRQFNDPRGNVPHNNLPGRPQYGQFAPQRAQWAPPQGMAGLSREVAPAATYAYSQPPPPTRGQPYHYQSQQQPQRPAGYSHAQAVGSHARPPPGRPYAPPSMQQIQPDQRAPQMSSFNYGALNSLPPPPPLQSPQAPLPAVAPMLSIQSMRESLARTLNKQQ